MMSHLSGQRHPFSRYEVPDTPLFDRELDGEEYADLQQCKRKIDGLNQRIGKLEKINVDLEKRLEDEAKQNLAMEKECVSIERKCKSKCDQLESIINKLNGELDTEKNKNTRLREQVSRTEKELYGILQRKYELMRGPASNNSSKAGPKSGATETTTLLKKSEGGVSDLDLFQMSKVSLYRIVILFIIETIILY